MSCKVMDNKLLKKYTKIQKNICILYGKKFDSEPVYGDNNKCIKIKLKIYDGKVNTTFQGKKWQKNASYKCLSLIMLDSVVEAKNV